MTWALVPLLAVIHVPLALILMIVIPGMAVAAWATFIKFPPVIAAMNDEIRRQRFVPPPRRNEGARPRPPPPDAAAAIDRSHAPAIDNLRGWRTLMP